MKRLIFLQGLPASGKTTWAKAKLAALNQGGKRRAIRTNKDEIRAKLHAKGIDNENKVVFRETELINQALKRGLNVIVDNTHFNPIHKWRYRDLAREHGYQFEIIRFKVSLRECIRRDRERKNPIGEHAIRVMDEYRKSLSPIVVANLKKLWTAKKAAAAKKGHITL